MIKFKQGVSVTTLAPQIILAIAVAESVYKEITGTNLIITSGCDGQHLPNSKHYLGLAVDLRTKHLGRDRKVMVLTKLKECLGAEYLVLFENVDQPNEHFHIQYNANA